MKILFYICATLLVTEGAFARRLTCYFEKDGKEIRIEETASGSEKYNIYVRNNNGLLIVGDYFTAEDVRNGEHVPTSRPTSGFLYRKVQGSNYDFYFARFGRSGLLIAWVSVYNESFRNGDGDYYSVPVSCKTI